MIAPTIDRRAHTEQKTRLSAFTLTEIVLSLGIISSALVALIALLPIGIDASRKAGSHTVVATVLEDLRERLRGQRLKEGDASFSPAFYDESGAYLSPEIVAHDWAQPYYRAEVRMLDRSSAPEHTSGVRPVKVDLYWPIDPQTGDSIPGGRPNATITFGVTPLTGPDWSRIDSRYVQTIEY
jgi:uncharacterized protein (TIGR02598 family)